LDERASTTFEEAFFPNEDFSFGSLMDFDFEDFVRLVTSLTSISIDEEVRSSFVSLRKGSRALAWSVGSKKEKSDDS
tara:strand:- start:198 stop:428 length:231 start_codon:yes stop_codon:yes gene_type:complete